MIETLLITSLIVTIILAYKIYNLETDISIIVTPNEDVFDAKYRAYKLENDVKLLKIENEKLNDELDKYYKNIIETIYQNQKEYK
jgi:hypothetical protein